MTDTNEGSNGLSDALADSAATHHASVSRHGAINAVYLSGELDAVNAPVVERALAMALSDLADRDGEALEVDLSAVTLIDSTGISALVRTRRKALSAGRSFSVTAASPSVRRLLTLTRLDEVFLLPPA